MKRPNYLSKYLFDWELFDVIVGGHPALDSHSFLSDFLTPEKVNNFLMSYGFDQEDPVLNAELFGNFQEAMQFIKRYFLKGNNPDGPDLTIPSLFSSITNISDLFLIARGVRKGVTIKEEKLWGRIILKVMHTIVHVDKDIRYNYFSIIQQQIFDRFYKYITRDNQGKLYLGIDKNDKVPLYDFHTKSKKKRDSVVIKLLHKPENVAEELFDRVGLRFITHNKIDSLRIIRFLQKKNIIIPHNMKPSRSVNSLIDIDIFKYKYKSLVRSAIRNDWSEDQFLEKINQAAEESPSHTKIKFRNTMTSKKYRSIQFTCCQLIHYRNPFMSNFNHLKKMAKNELGKNENTELAKKILELDTSLIAKDVRFFYPFEVQIVDMANHKFNTKGEASHNQYKKLQTKVAILRLFNPLLEYKNLTL